MRLSDLLIILLLKAVTDQRFNKENHYSKFAKRSYSSLTDKLRRRLTQSFKKGQTGNKIWVLLKPGCDASGNAV